MQIAEFPHADTILFTFSCTLRYCVINSNSSDTAAQAAGYQRFAVQVLT